MFGRNYSVYSGWINKWGESKRGVGRGPYWGSLFDDWVFAAYSDVGIYFDVGVVCRQKTLVGKWEGTKWLGILKQNVVQIGIIDLLMKLYKLRGGTPTSQKSLCVVGLTVSTSLRVNIVLANLPVCWRRSFKFRQARASFDVLESEMNSVLEM